jgi:sugar PTS system EIIA component
VTSRTVLQLCAPFTGVVVPLEALPDPVYSCGVVGAGLAVLPDPGTVTVGSPIAGIVHAMLPHAVMVVGDHGRSVLVHLGTRELNGNVVERVQVGARVNAGDPLLVWQMGGAGGDTDASPLIALQAAPGQVLSVVESGERVEPGQPVLFWS